MTVDERRVTTALQSFARGLVVTDQDLDRLEERLDGRLHPAMHRDQRPRVWEWTVAACAVVALVLASVALWRSGAEQATPATPSIVPEDLAGMWVNDVEGSEWLWHFTADGQLAFSSTAAGYVNRYDHTTFTIEGDLLSFRDRGQLCRSTVRLPAEGRMALIPVRRGAGCSLHSEDDASWRFFRVSPVSLAGATLAVRNLDRAGPPTRVEDMTDVIGTWLLEGTGTTLVVARTSPGVGKYVVDDDGDGHVIPDQWGRVTLRPEGGIVLRPEGGTQGITLRPKGGTHEVCETVYTRAITTGATLETEVDATSCDRFGVRGDTWIRLN